MLETTEVKDTTFDNMVSFGLKLAWCNLLALVIIIILSSIWAESENHWIEIGMTLFSSVNMMANILVFCFGAVGLFKSSRKGSALLALFIALVIFANYGLVMLIAE